MKYLVILSMVLFLASCGDDGRDGVDGAQGPQGIQGNTGAQGDKGDKGDNGDTGAQGPKGDKGDKGNTGNTGPQGSPGPQGNPGTPGTVITPLQLCDASFVPSYPNVYPEYALCISNKLYGVYSANDGFLAFLPPGSYVSHGIHADCTFTVAANCVIVH